MVDRPRGDGPVDVGAHRVPPADVGDPGSRGRPRGPRPRASRRRPARCAGARAAPRRGRGSTSRCRRCRAPAAAAGEEGRLDRAGDRGQHRAQLGLRSRRRRPPRSRGMCSSRRGVSPTTSRTSRRAHAALPVIWSSPSPSRRSRDQASSAAMPGDQLVGVGRAAARRAARTRCRSPPRRGRSDRRSAPPSSAAARRRARSLVDRSGGAGSACSGTWKCTRHGSGRAAAGAPPGPRAGRRARRRACRGVARLVQEARLDVRRQRGTGRRVGGVLGVQRRRDLHLDDRQPGVGDLPHGGGGLLEARGEVAGSRQTPSVSVSTIPPRRAHRRRAVVSTTQPGSGSNATRIGRPVSALDLASASAELAEPSPGRGVAVGVPRRRASRAAAVEMEPRAASSGSRSASTVAQVEGVVEPAARRSSRAGRRRA